jgi:hypothetical protein
VSRITKTACASVDDLSEAGAFDDLSEAGANGWKPLVAFVHIPRTGGGSVTSAISNNYGRAKSPGNCQTGPEKAHSVLQRIAAHLDSWSGRALADHVPYGLYRRYLPADTRYITFLRDPVERVLAHYYFHANQNKLAQQWAQLTARDHLEREGSSGGPVTTSAVPADGECSLEEGLARKIVIYDNFATRFLWGGESLFGDLPPDAVNQAKENISRFAFIGITERLDESLVLLGTTLGIGLMPYHLRHVSTELPTAGDISGELRKLIEEHNAFDLELYRHAREQFDEAAAAAGDLAPAVDELLRRSADVSAATEAALPAVKARKRERQSRKRGRAAPAGATEAAEAAEAVVPAQPAGKSEARQSRNRKRAAPAGATEAAEAVVPAQPARRSEASATQTDARPAQKSARATQRKTRHEQDGGSTGAAQGGELRDEVDELKRRLTAIEERLDGWDR